MTNFFNTLPEKEFTIWNTLLSAGFNTYLVGGAVRDILLGQTPKDFDFATEATPDQITALFSSFDNHKHFKLDFVGESFGVMMINRVEVATFRGDRYFGGGDKDVEINYVDTIEEDLSRRDFTVNAMAMTVDGDVIDPYNGKDDLLGHDKPIIKFVGNPTDRINEDPNRILRAFRFISRFDGLFDDDTCNSLIENIEKLSMVAPERIRLEIIKTMESAKKASIFWGLLRICGGLSYVFPELGDGYEHDHGNYHNEDVWVHNMLAGDYMSCDNPFLKLAGYLHDVGKPASYNPDNRTFYEHHKMGADIIRKRLIELKFSSGEIRYIVNLVLIHMDGTRGMTDKSRRRLKNKLSRYDIQWEEYLAIRIADRHANTSRPDFTSEQVNEYIDMFTMEEVVPVDVNSLILSGGQLIDIFNLTPGPLVGKIQRELLRLVIEDGDFNTVTSLVDHVVDVFDIEPDIKKVHALNN